MNLEELTEPLFQYVCRINRSVRRGAIPEENQIRADVLGIFDDMHTRAAIQPGLLAQFEGEKLELPLFYFVDSTINSSRLPYAMLWEPLAKERYNKTNGDEDFWNKLADTLKDRSRDADERLKVFYTCLGLGFTGSYMNQPDQIKRNMKDIAIRLRINRESGSGGRIVPEAYENVIRKPLELRTDRTILIVVLALLGMLTVLFATNMVLYRNAVANLHAALNHIIGN